MQTGQLTLVHEFTTGTAATRVDRDKGLLVGVKILGRKSLNGREYTTEALSAAVKRYEGRPVNVDHHRGPDAAPPAEKRFGVIRRPEVRDDGIYGDVEYLTTHPMAPRVAEAAERMPNVFGFSHAAFVGYGKGLRSKIVEEIGRVESVDLVTEPGTTGGLFESREHGMADTKTASITLKQIQESAKWKPATKKWIKDLAEAAGMPAEAPVDVAEPAATTGETAADHENMLKAGFKAAIGAVIDDDSMDTKAKLAKIKQILTSQDKLIGGGDTGGSDSSEPPADAGPASESRKGSKASGDLVKIEEQFNLRLQARDLCAEAGIVPTKILRKALDASTSEAEIKELIEEAKQQQSAIPQPSTNHKPKSVAVGGARSSSSTPATKVIESKLDFGTGDEARQKRNSFMRTGVLR